MIIIGTIGLLALFHLVFDSTQITHFCEFILFDESPPQPNLKSIEWAPTILNLFIVLLGLVLTFTFDIKTKRFIEKQNVIHVNLTGQNQPSSKFLTTSKC